MGKREKAGAKTTVPLIRIVLSSPGDVAEERQAARQLIDSVLPKLPALRGRVAFELIAWDDPAASIPLLAHESPQESVNAARPRPATCDIVIVILWARMGTPLPETIRRPDGTPYLSGTEWEFDDAIHSTWDPKPEVLLYRRREEPRIGMRDPEKKEKEKQFERVEAFIAALRNKNRGINEYENAADFSSLFRQHLEDLLHRRLGPAPADPATDGGAAEVPEDYVAWLRRTCADVSLLGQDLDKGHAVTLDHVYVPALTQRPATPADPEPDQLEPMTLLERLDGESLFVEAPAGAGKSTFCRWAVLQSLPGAPSVHPVPAPEGFAEPEPKTLKGRLPLLVPLREFWPQTDWGRGERQWTRGRLEEALSGWVDRSEFDGLAGALVIAHLRAGSAVLLLDGLDEVPPSHMHEGTTVFPRDRLLSGLADALPFWKKAGNRVLLTSRPYGLDGAGLPRLDLVAAPLAPLPEALQHLFVARWFHTLGKADLTKGCIATIGERDELAPLVENPMLLTALCVLYGSGRRLPEDRYELYKSLVRNVLHNRYPGEARVRDPVERRLEAIALGMHTGEGAGAPRPTPAAEVSWVEVERLLAHFAERNPAYEAGQVEASARREELLNRSGLLVPRAGERAQFYHLSFQEFLAAQRLTRTADDAKAVFCERAAVAQWRPTLLFLLAAEIAKRDAQWGLDLLATLIEDQDRRAVKANPHPAHLVAEALETCLAKNYAVPDEIKERFTALALHAIEDEVDLKTRQALGLALGRLGDPRIRSLRDPEACVEVPAGTYPLGEDKKRRVVTMAAPFRLGRYPVTNGQYGEFMDDGGYENLQWWSDGGRKWLAKEGATEPRFWRERRWNGPNQPVVGVSFWEAEACAAWAGGRLPTEAEWEAAARGPEGLAYPWGNDWEDGICNNFEAGLGVTSPVGLFPRSRQARLGIEDLSGNVWEWCSNVLDARRDGDERYRLPVVRGGSWGGLPGGCRAAYRGRIEPHYRNGNRGFRVARTLD